MKRDKWIFRDDLKIIRLYRLCPPAKRWAALNVAYARTSDRARRKACRRLGWNYSKCWANWITGTLESVPAGPDKRKLPAGS